MQISCQFYFMHKSQIQKKTNPKKPNKTITKNQTLTMKLANCLRLVVNLNDCEKCMVVVTILCWLLICVLQTVEYQWF